MMLYELDDVERHVLTSETTPPKAVEVESIRRLLHEMREARKEHRTADLDNGERAGNADD